MPIVEAEPRGTLRPTPLKLDEDVRRKMIAYAKYCGSSTDRVIRVALTRLFEQDKDFDPYIQAHPELLEVRKRVRKTKPAGAAPTPEATKDKK